MWRILNLSFNWNICAGFGYVNFFSIFFFLDSRTGHVCATRYTNTFFQFHSWTWFCHFECTIKIFPLDFGGCSVCFIWKFYFFVCSILFYFSLNNELFLFVFFFFIFVFILTKPSGLTFCFYSTFYDTLFLLHVCCCCRFFYNQNLYTIKCRDHFWQL